MQDHYRSAGTPMHTTTTRGTALPQHLASTTGVGETVAHLSSAYGGGSAASALAEPKLDPYTSGLPGKVT